MSTEALSERAKKAVLAYNVKECVAGQKKIVIA